MQAQRLQPTGSTKCQKTFSLTLEIKDADTATCSPKYNTKPPNRETRFEMTRIWYIDTEPIASRNYNFNAERKFRRNSRGLTRVLKLQWAGLGHDLGEHHDHDFRQSHHGRVGFLDVLAQIRRGHDRSFHHDWRCIQPPRMQKILVDVAQPRSLRPQFGGD